MSTKHKVFEIVANVLEVKPQELTEATKPTDVEKWDSMRHMMVFLALGEEFNINFTDADLVSVGSVGEFVTMLEAKTKSQ